MTFYTIFSLYPWPLRSLFYNVLLPPPTTYTMSGFSKLLTLPVLCSPLKEDSTIVLIISSTLTALIYAPNCILPLSSGLQPRVPSSPVTQCHPPLNNTPSSPPNPSQLSYFWRWGNIPSVLQAQRRQIFRIFLKLLYVSVILISLKHFPDIFLLCHVHHHLTHWLVTELSSQVAAIHVLCKQSC